jgi:hypothetical protein
MLPRDVLTEIRGDGKNEIHASQYSVTNAARSEARDEMMMLLVSD